jgi:hypothetical protein
MPIVTSSIVSRLPQHGGGTLIVERHIDHTGRIHDQQYVADDSVDVDAVLSARAIKIGEAIDQAEIIEQEANNFVIALRPNEFMDLFDYTEAKAIIAASKTDDDVGYFWAYLNTSMSVRKNHPKTQAGVALLVAKGLITQQRADEILA